MNTNTMLNRIKSIKQLRRLLDLSKPVAKLLFNIIGLKVNLGGYKFDAALKTIIVVSHEASRTGAPILAWNIVEHLNRKANVITILMRGGELRESFIDSSYAVIEPRFNIVPMCALDNALKRICNGRYPECSIVNSIVSTPALRPLKKLGIPTISLIHEFGAYIRPLEILTEVGLWSNRIIYSTELTMKDIINRCPEIADVPTEIMAQGACKTPTKNQLSKPRFPEDQGWEFLNEIEESEILILGAGEVQQRKGVDLFVSIANIIMNNIGDKCIKFAWIGSGYDPVNDFNVSLWLDDQIEKMNLSNKLTILEPTGAYQALQKRANIFLMTSRLDPLPNVGIDSMLQGTPILCFDKACGIAELLRQDDILRETLVIPYLDINKMANRVLEILENTDDLCRISKRCQEKAINWFNMGEYMRKLEKTIESCSIEEQSIKKELAYLIENKTLGLKANSTSIIANKEVDWLKYIQSWRNNIWPKRPIRGFHPGIYNELIMDKSIKGDPLVHYLQSGMPKGEWNNNLITEHDSFQQSKRAIRIALHVHIYYVDLAKDIIKRISKNRNGVSLFISCRNSNDAKLIRTLCENYGLDIYDIKVVPNRGRDIGPLLTCFGTVMDEEFDIHGHIHTKKSKYMNESDSNLWREFLLGNMLGDSKVRMLDNIVEAFNSDPELGIVFPEDTTCVGWCGNYEKAKELAKELRIERLPKHFNFPVGSMFWARKGALTDIYKYNMKWDDYPKEPIKDDGTLLHAIERLLPMIAAKNGYNYRMTYVSSLNR